MPYLHLDLAKTYPSETKRELATRLCHLYEDGLESITMVLAEIRRGRSDDQRLELGRRIVDICSEVLDVPKKTVLVEFTVHTGEEILRDGKWAGDWTDAEASAGRPNAAAVAGQ
jgi:phenylpyruvate tautomerase PptA (4-oxalocrotonate tautomerase family)